MKTYNFTLRQLQYIVAVAEMMSFRGAAELCNVAQPSLSAQVAEMEAALGVSLFERDRRGVLLTSAGQEIIRRARRVLVEADDFIEAANRFVDPLAGTLVLGQRNSQVIFGDEPCLNQALTDLLSHAASSRVARLG